MRILIFPITAFLLLLTASATDGFIAQVGLIVLAGVSMAVMFRVLRVKP